MDRTVRVKLQPTPEQAEVLAETLRLFTQAFNAVCAYGWAHGEKNGVRLHHATYYACKAEAPALVSDLHIQARVKATEAVKSALALKRKSRKVSAPSARACRRATTYTPSRSIGRGSKYACRRREVA